MTIIRGVRILEAPCCGARFALPRYVSMNFSAFEYWTDGWREGSLMPNDAGLRRCLCSRFVRLAEMTEVGSAEVSDLPTMDHVQGPFLPECIDQARDQVMEVAARLSYWRYLNHPYRDMYRKHRDKGEADTKTRWEAEQPDTRSWWRKLRGRKSLEYLRPPNSPFTYPLFNPTPEQLNNMARLCEIFLTWDREDFFGYRIDLAELYREQGRFEEAEHEIASLDEAQDGVTVQLIKRLINQRETAPMRYRM